LPTSVSSAKRVHLETRPLFSGPYGFDELSVNYDVAPDGERFLLPRSRVDSAPRQLELVLNWFEELNRLAPK
jgi:hypothetical protein